MRLSPEYLERLENATQKGFEQGFQTGFQRAFQKILKERRLMVETLLIFRFGEIDQKLSNIIEPLTQISAAESTSLLRSLSKEDLLSRFNN